MSKIYDKLHTIELILSPGDSLFQRTPIRAEFTYRRHYDNKGNEVPEIETLKFYLNGDIFKHDVIQLTEQDSKTEAIASFIKHEQRYITDLIGDM